MRPTISFCKAFFILLALPCLGMASYQPITGSTVTVNPPAGSSMPVTMSGFPLTPSGVSASTVAVQIAYSPTVTGIITSSTTVIASTVTGYSNVTFSITPGTSTGVTVQFEGSPDNGTNWIGYQSVQNGTVVISTSFALSTSSTIWTSNVAGLTHFRVRASSWTAGKSTVTIVNTSPSYVRSIVASEIVQNGSGIPIAVGYQIGGSSVPVKVQNTVTVTPATVFPVSQSGNFVTLPDFLTVAAFTAGYPPFVPADYTDDFSELCGNDTKLTIVTGLRLTCYQTTSGLIALGVFKRTGVYDVPYTAIPVVSRYLPSVAALSDPVVFDVAPGVVLGTITGNLAYEFINCPAPAADRPNQIYENPTNWMTNAVVLIDSNDCIGIGTNGGDVPGGVFTVTWDWFEE